LPLDRLEGHYGRDKKYFNIFGKFGVPRPVTGSQPGTAENPLVLHPGFVPFVISLNIDGFAYNDGFRKPMGFFPTASLSSFKRLITAPKIGALADVPPVLLYFPPLDT
jgi:hypothetical protein